MRNGQVKGYRQKRNGSLQPEAEILANYMPGVIGLIRKGNGWRIPGRVSFRRWTKVMMASAVLHRLSNFHQTAMDYMILVAMYGNGATTGTVRIIIEHLPTQNCLMTHRDQMN